MTSCSCFGKKPKSTEPTEKTKLVPISIPPAKKASIPWRTNLFAEKPTPIEEKKPSTNGVPTADTTSSKNASPEFLPALEFSPALDFTPARNGTVPAETLNPATATTLAEPTSQSTNATTVRESTPAANKIAFPEASVPVTESTVTKPKSQPTNPSTDTTSTPKMADALKGASSGVTNNVSSGAQQASSGAQSVGSGAQSAASNAQDTVTGGGSEGSHKWDAMTEEQKRQTFDALPEDKKKGKTYYEWVSEGYQYQKENWMPWIEDFYLRWFTKDNKASYATKEGLDKTKVTGIEQVDTLQDGVNGLVSQQVGKGGLLQPVGDMASSEGINRAERGGKDDKGNYLGPADGAVSSAGGKEEMGSYAGSAGGAVSSAGGSVWGGAKSAGGYVGGMFGGKKEGTEGNK